MDKVFDDLLQRESIFINREVLTHDYVPEELPHREDEITKLAYILASALKGGKPSNVLMYGKTGTGKTAVARYVLKKLVERASSIGLSLSYAYVNCKYRKTNYRVLAKICEELGCTGIPETGLPTDVVLDRLWKYVEKLDRLVIVILDELDWLVRNSGDDTLYQLTRINNDLKRSKVSIIGITNDLKFREYLDSRVLSSLSEETLVFKPYNSQQLYNILKMRAELAFKPGVVSEEALKLAAALAAQEHGDARRAIDLLRVAGEIADRKGDTKLTTEHILISQKQVERDIIEAVIRKLPQQEQVVLLSLAILADKGETITTGLAKKVYEQICNYLGLRPVTLRRLNDIFADLETLGIISATIRSMGRYGRTRIIRLEVPLPVLINVLLEEERYREYIEMAIPSLQKVL
ncbi:MAG: Cdc6/Cdc18 family protein [Candidatus Njordarchaeia archaeon]